MLLFVRPEQQPRVREALSGLLHVPFDLASAGSHVIFYEREGSPA
jgi:D-glycero-alpha-D-manno-heptose-7-phosphate kinase